ncbi:MAG: MFS transporter [Terracidiphilus sp.]|jgi:MFS transporter, FHS family, glucose/mannose:H+ symporter
MNFGVLRRGPRIVLRNAEGEESATNPAALTNSSPLLNRASTIVLSVGSSLTGAGTVMLGVILPALSQRWGLRDDQAGFLMFLQFFASGLGALVTGMNRVRSMAIGYGLLVATLCALVVGEGQFAYVAFFFYGLGLGIAITSTNLFFSDHWGNLRATKLVWLSFAWSAGAAAGPVCILPLLHRGDFGSVFLMMLILFLAMFAWVILIERQGPAAGLVQRPQRLNRSVQTFFSILLVLAMSFVGVEAVLSGWLTTYSHRAGIRDLAGAALATSIFWLGEMLSRLAFSTRLLTKVGGRKVMMWGSTGVTLSTILLIAFPHPWVIFLVAGVAGAFVGPLYPLSLSYLLELSPRGWFFAMGGIGAAIFPWITGSVSAHYHSLRCGLVVPVVAGLGMIVLIVLTFRRLQPV